MNLAGMKFRAVSNSSNGTLNGDTVMKFTSDDENGIFGTYAGGMIRAGSVAALRKDSVTVNMLYHCVTTTGELKAGRAVATFIHDAQSKLKMQLEWQWLTGDRTRGNSEWVHIK